MQNNQLAPGVGFQFSQTLPSPIAQAIKEAASLIAEAIHANAEATVLLARATAGEFEDGDTVAGEVEQYLDGTNRT